MDTGLPTGRPRLDGTRTAAVRLVVDHDHETGAIRGLLCGPCNSAIGLLGESVEALRSAVEYLARGRHPCLQPTIF